MNRPFILLLLVSFMVSVESTAMQAASPGRTQASPDLRLWYRAPANDWNHALPVGNGRLGAMVFGGTAEERIQFNEETLWSGGPYDPVNPGGNRALPEIRRLLFDGDQARAHDLFGRTMMGIPYEQQKFQPFGDLILWFPGHDQPEEYRRELDLSQAVVRVRYRVGEVTFLRETFASAVDQVIVVRLTADRSGSISFDAELHGTRNTMHSNYGTGYFQMDGIVPDTLLLTGSNSDYLGIPGGLRYEARVVLRTDGGTSEVDYRTLRVRDADSATLILAAATSFVDYTDVSGDPAERVRKVLSSVSSRDYAAILADHIDEYRGWFNRVALNLGPATDRNPDLPTNERIERLRTAPDPALAALYYQFGRYLLISSSRPGTEPANLQGIWNDNSNPWWDSKYTVNVNLPMNYWPADTGGLAELVEPLFGLVRDVSITGRSIAREHWGAAGWVLHQNTDLWRAAAPMDGPSWGAWPVGGAWLVTGLWDHYLFTRDRSFLERLYPLMRESVRFLSDILVEDPRNGWLVTAPSNSPENFPARPGNERFFDEVSGLYLKARTMAVGPTMDMQIIREVFEEFGTASTLLKRDANLRDRVMNQRMRLAPDQIGKHGQLQEWIEDWDELEPQHRHVSPLWGLYPGKEVSPRRTPELATAAAVTLERRGTGGCGWSYAWKSALWARLLRPEKAIQEFRSHLTESSLPNLFSLCGRALQVDGNLGGSAGIAEMLLQSHEGVIDLLPAMPAEWSEGSFRGLRARGGFSVDLSWNGGAWYEAIIHSTQGGSCVVRGGTVTGVRSEGKPVDFATLSDGRITFETEAGRSYLLLPNQTR